MTDPAMRHFAAAAGGAQLSRRDAQQFGGLIRYQQAVHGTIPVV